MSISVSDFMGMPLFIPTLPEQQKIADCLGSLDSLITAQTQQIESLKTHKKGLMQQLFPNPEGERSEDLEMKREKIGGKTES